MSDQEANDFVRKYTVPCYLERDELLKMLTVTCDVNTEGLEKKRYLDKLEKELDTDPYVKGLWL